MNIKRLSIIPKLVTGGAIYPYSEELLEKGERKTTFGDPYNLFEVVGGEEVKRIWVPRNMAPHGSEKEYSEGFAVNFTSKFKARHEEQTRVVEESVHLLLQDDNFITECPPGFGKCHGRGTPVIMFDGSVRAVQDVVPGDLLMGDDSTPRSVLSVTQGYGDLFLITPNNGDPFVCNDVHVLSLKSTCSEGTKYQRGSVVNIPLNEYLQESGTFKHRMKLWKVGVSFPHSPKLHMDPYFLGAMLGDGSMGAKIGLTTMDPELVSMVYAMAGKYCVNVRVESQEGNASKTYYFVQEGTTEHGNLLRNSLRRLGLLGVSCGDKFIPPHYLRGSIEERLHLLAGLIDTDGHHTKNCYEVTFKSKRLHDDLVFLARSLGFGVSRAEKSVNGVSYYRAFISGDTDRIPVRIPRKKAAPRTQKKDVLLSGFSVTYLGKGDYYGFTLDGNSLYLLGDFTVTHNTACAMEVIAQVGRKTIVVVTKEDIRDQWADAFKKFLGLVDADIGYIQADKFQITGKKVVIAMVHSLSKEGRYPAHQFREFGLAIWDESGSPDTLVTTSKGQVRIQDLVRSKTQCKALSFNTDTGGYEWREIRAYHEHPPKNPMMRITHESGYLDFTSEHLLYTDRGWVKAKDLLVTDFLTLDTEHSVLYNNSKQLETKNGSMATRDSSWRYLSPNWGYQDKSQIESSAWGSSNTTGHGEVSTARALRPHTPQRGGESRLGRALLLLCNVATGLVDSLLPRHLYTGWSQNPSAITCKSTLARVAGLVGNGRWVKSGWVHSTVSKQVSGVRRGESSNTSFSVRYEKFIEKSQGVLSRILKRVEQTTKARVSPVLHTLNDVQVRWCAFWRKSSSVQGVWLRHSHEGRGAAQTGILSEGNLPKGKEVHELPTETYSSFGGSKTKSNKMGGKVRVLSVEEIATPGLVYDIEVEGNHNFVANGVVVHNCHRVGAEQFAKSCYRLPAKLRWGLSATPDRKDGRLETIHAHLGPVLVKSNAAPMTPKVIVRKSPWKIPQTKITDPKTGQATIGPIPHTAGKCGHVINILARNHHRNVMLADFAYQAHKNGRNVLVQSDRVEHLEMLALLIQKCGVPPGEFAFYVGGLTKEQREYAKTKRIIMASYQMTAEATDIPQMDTLVMGTPKSDIRQIIGRITRWLDGKKQPLIFDLVDDSSSVFKGYAKTRMELYVTLGAEINRTTVVKKSA